MIKLIIAPLYYFYSNHRDPFPKRVNLGNGYYLKRFNPSELSDALEFFHDSLSEFDRDELNSCRYAIYYRYESDIDDSQTPIEVVNEINRITQTLRIIRPTRVIASILHFRVERRHKIALQITFKPNQIALTDTTVGNQHFTKSDGRRIRIYFNKIRGLYESYGGNYQRVLNAVIFFEIGHQNYLYKPRMVNFITCLESLFNTSDQQIGYSLRIRCSYFLEKDSATRLELSKELKKIYGLRSKFVHGQSTQRTLLNNIAEQNRLILLTENIARKCLQKILDKDLISIFDNLDTLNTEFENLEYGLPTPLN